MALLLIYLKIYNTVLIAVGIILVLLFFNERVKGVSHVHAMVCCFFCFRRGNSPLASYSKYLQKLTPAVSPSLKNSHSSVFLLELF